MKPTFNMPSKTKKMRQEKCIERGGEKAKSKGQDCCVEILLSANSLTLQANILHLNEKDVKCTTGK